MSFNQPANKKPVYIVQGAQWGSEGKGQISAVLAEAKRVGAVVRTGSINAGHTVYHAQTPYKMQLLPTAWVVPTVKLILGPGCFIHRELLFKEWRAIYHATGEDIRDRLFIDYRCSVHSTEAEGRGHESPRHHEMGATGKGSSEAVVERLMKRNDIRSAREHLFSTNPRVTANADNTFPNESVDFGRCICDTTNLQMHILDHSPLLLEGTQGAHLDLFTGPWPFTTNRPVSTAAWLAYAGLPPTLDIRPILVARTYPIRVAGNSGPMPHEWTWPGLARCIRDTGRKGVPVPDEEALKRYEVELTTALRARGCPMDHQIDLWSDRAKEEYRVALSECPGEAMACVPLDQRLQLQAFFEMTTVTRKIRRVARWDYQTVQQAIDWNGCSELWISFLNYKHPETWGTTTWPGGGSKAAYWLQRVSEQLRVPITGITTERYPDNHILLPQ